MSAVNNATLDLICRFEGFVDHWYPDPAHGWKVPTCCYGHTDAAGEPKYADTKSKRFTKAEGRLILDRDLAEVAARVRKSVKVDLNENQFGAVVSFTYNVGQGNLSKSTLLKKLNKGDYAGAAGEFDRWVHAAGARLDGLVSRRKAERLLFLASGKPVQPDPARPGATTPPEPASARTNALAAIVAWLVNLIAALFRRK